MKKTIIAILDKLLFIPLFIILLPWLMITGAIQRPIRYFRLVSRRANNKEDRMYYF